MMFRQISLALASVITLPTAPWLELIEECSCEVHTLGKRGEICMVSLSVFFGCSARLLTWGRSS